MNLLNAAADWAFPDPAEEQRKREEEALRRRERQARAAAARRPSLPTVSPMGMAMGMASAMPMQHARHMAGMHGDIMSAIQRENDSRVSQLREMRRLQHEQALEQKKYDLLLQKLRMEAEAAEKKRLMEQEIAVSRGLLKKVRRNDGRGGGFYTTYEAR